MHVYNLEYDSFEFYKILESKQMFKKKQKKII
jgi:hypothetical protein